MKDDEPHDVTQFQVGDGRYFVDCRGTAEDARGPLGTAGMTGNDGERWGTKQCRPSLSWPRFKEFRTEYRN